MWLDKFGLLHGENRLYDLFFPLEANHRKRKTMTRRFPRVMEALRRRLSAGPDEYWVKGSERVHVPRSQVNEIPKLIKDYHDRLRRTEELRAMLRNGSVL